MTNDEIKAIAEEVGLPRGYYDGIYFDEDGNPQEGLSKQMKDFVRAIEFLAVVRFKKNQQTTEG